MQHPLGGLTLRLFWDPRATRLRNCVTNLGEWVLTRGSRLTLLLGPHFLAGTSLPKNQLIWDSASLGWLYVLQEVVVIDTLGSGIYFMGIGLYHQEFPLEVPRIDFVVRQPSKEFTRA